MKRALIIAPHQDDEVIGCGGTIAYLKAQDWDVSVLHVFKGNTNTSLVDGATLRHEEAKKAGAILGFTLLGSLGYQDRQEHNIQEIIRKVVMIIRNHKPNLIFLPHEHDKDQEHELVAKIGREASWLSNSESYMQGTTYTPTAVFFYEVWMPIQVPTIYLDITQYIEQKRKALATYHSQMEKKSWMEGSIGLNAYRGCTLQNHGYAECFTMAPVNIQAFSKLLGDICGNQ